MSRVVTLQDEEVDRILLSEVTMVVKPLLDSVNIDLFTVHWIQSSIPSRNVALVTTRTVSEAKFYNPFGCAGEKVYVGKRNSTERITIRVKESYLINACQMTEQVMRSCGFVNRKQFVQWWNKTHGSRGFKWEQHPFIWIATIS